MMSQGTLLQRFEERLLREVARTEGEERCTDGARPPGTLAHAKEIVADVEASTAAFVPEDLRTAVLYRHALVTGWPVWSAGTTAPGGAHAEVPGTLFQAPPDVAYMEALQWALSNVAPELVATRSGLEEELRRAEAQRLTAAGSMFEVPHPATGEVRRLVPYQLGVLYSVWRAVEQDRRRPALAIDANAAHHQLLMGWTEASTEREITARGRSGEGGYVELVLPGQQQIALGLPGEAHEKLIHALRDWRTPIGLRAYATLIHMLSIRGQRQGFVRWTLQEHLDVQGVPARERREKRLLQEATEVELMTQIELAVRESAKGRVRERRPIFLVGSRFERVAGTRWKLDGMELQANPLIWSGVRDVDTGKLGSNFGIGSDRLPRLNPRVHPAALALGLLLPIRFRLARNEGRDWVGMSGKNVLRYAGITPSRVNPGRTWAMLAEDLDELQRIGGIGGWGWQGGTPGFDEIVRFEMPEWQRDRLFHSVSPRELVAPAPLTGSELKVWRVQQGLSQKSAAQRLGVGEATVKRAEKAASDALGPAMRAALARVFAELGRTVGA